MSILTNRPRPVSLIILLYYIILYYTYWHKFWHLNPSVGRGESAGKIFPTMLLHLWFFFNLICNRTMFWTSWILTYWPQGLGGGGGLPAKYLLPFCCIGDILKFNMQYVYVLKNLDPQCWRGGGVCWQNIPYYVAACVIPFNLICNMTIFWRSWILSFRPNHLSPPRGSYRCLWSKITFDMFHNYFTSVCMRQFSKKKVDNWLSYCKI